MVLMMMMMISKALEKNLVGIKSEIKFKRRFKPWQHLILKESKAMNLQL